MPANWPIPFLPCPPSWCGLPAPAAADTRSTPASPGTVHGVGPDTRAEHEARTAELVAGYAAIPPGAPVRLAKPTSNLFRSRQRSSAPRLDVKTLDSVLSVDPVARTADVEGMTTYERLVDATLEHGLMPLVV